MITLDWTLIATGAVFLLTLWGLNVLLFRPLLEIFDSRKSMTSERKDEAAERLEYRDALFEKYSAKVKEAKQRGYQLAEEVRREASATRQEKLAEAREASEERVAQAKKKIQQEIDRAKDEIKKNAGEIAEIISRQILRKA